MRVYVLPGGMLEARGLGAILDSLGQPAVVESLYQVSDAVASLEADATAILIVRGGERLLADVASEISLSGADGRIIAILTGDTGPASYHRWVIQGWSLILENGDEDALGHALRTVLAGQRFIDPVAIGFLSSVIDEHWGPRMLERIDPGKRLPRHTWGTALLTVLGLPDTEIAECIGRSIKTVQSYRSEIYEKLGIRGHRELAKLAFGVPPCGGVSSRCVDSARAASVVGVARQVIPGCPCFPLCVAAFRRS